MGWRVLGEGCAAEFLAADTGAAEKGLHPGAVRWGRGLVWEKRGLGVPGARIPGWVSELLGLRNMRTN